MSQRLIKVKTSFHLIQVHRLPMNCFHGVRLGSQQREQPKEREESKKRLSLVLRSAKWDRRGTNVVHVRGLSPPNHGMSSELKNSIFSWSEKEGVKEGMRPPCHRLLVRWMTPRWQTCKDGINPIRTCYTKPYAWKYVPTGVNTVEI